MYPVPLLPVDFKRLEAVSRFHDRIPEFLQQFPGEGPGGFVVLDQQDLELPPAGGLGPRGLGAGGACPGVGAGTAAAAGG